jgi:hypothetical protein
MTSSGNIDCAEKLLQPARMVLKAGMHIGLEYPYERRVALWNEIRTNQDRFLREECGMFLEEVDLHMRSQFDASLIALVSVFLENNEDFPQIARFSTKEIGIWEKIERYNVMDIRSQDDILNMIIRRDTNLLELFRDYYLYMPQEVEDTLKDPEIRLTLRYYLKRRWNAYRGKMDTALADAVMKFDWFRELIKEWDRDREDARSD